MKTFNDLIFKAHSLEKFSEENKHAILFFPNGFGVSVLLGSSFFSNGIDTYELAILKGDKNNYELSYDTPITKGVLAHLSKDEVTEVMIRTQQLS